MTTHIEWNGQNLTLEITTYDSPKNKAIRLWDDKDMRCAKATVNPTFLLPNNQVVIKDYSENEGVLDALKKAGVVEETGEYTDVGYEKMPICRLLITK